MKTLRFAIILGTAALLLSARMAPAQTPSAASSASPVPNLATRQTPPHDARIRYSEGQLQVIADDSSLNLTLLQIAGVTGMGISGSATEERIFGTYGPAAPAAVIRTLLQGTGTNMLLTQSTVSGPAELVLTRQNGSVTPPQVHPATFGPPPAPTASAASVQPAPGTNTSMANPGAGQAESEWKPAEPPPPPIPLTSGERALLIDRLQQQQRQAARKP